LIGGEAAEAAVAEPGLLLLGEDLVEVVPQLGHRLPGLVLQAEVQQVVGEVRPQQELRRQVADGAAGLLPVGLARGHPAAHDLAAHGQGQGQVALVGCRPLGEASHGGEEGFLEVLLDGLDDRLVGHESSAMTSEHTAARKAMVLC
jgi:hypothetical protein